MPGYEGAECETSEYKARLLNKILQSRMIDEWLVNEYILPVFPKLITIKRTARKNTLNPVVLYAKCTCMFQED